MGSKPREGPIESLEEGLAGLVGRVNLSIPEQDERDSYNYVPLTVRGREKPRYEWRRYLFF